MRKLIFVILFMVSVSLSAQNDAGMNFFEGTWEEVLEEAKKNNSIIFVDAYAAWCGPCKWMAKNIFPAPVVGEFYNQNFINVKIDMEKGQGPDLAKKYNVRAYPTFLFLDSKGDVVHKAVGGRDTLDFIELGKTAIDDTKNLRAIRQAYEKDSENAEAILAYCKALKDCYDNSYANIIQSYMKGIDEQDLVKEINWKAIVDFVEDPSSREFKFLVENKDLFYEKYGEEDVNKKIDQVLKAMIYKASRIDGGFKMVMLKLDSMEIENKEMYLAYTEIMMYRKQQDYNNYANSVLSYIELAKPEIQEINSYAWQFFLRVEDKELLTEMAKIMKKSLEGVEDYAAQDTYASILFKLEKYTEALEEAEKAVELAKAANKNYDDTLELIEKIKKAMK